MNMWDFLACEECGYRRCRCPRVTNGGNTMELQRELEYMLIRAGALFSGVAVAGALAIVVWVAVKWMGAA